MARTSNTTAVDKKFDAIVSNLGTDSHALGPGTIVDGTPDSTPAASSFSGALTTESAHGERSHATHTTVVVDPSNGSALGVHSSSDGSALTRYAAGDNSVVPQTRPVRGMPGPFDKAAFVRGNAVMPTPNVKKVRAIIDSGQNAVAFTQPLPQHGKNWTIEEVTMLRVTRLLEEMNTHVLVTTPSAGGRNSFNQNLEEIHAPAGIEDIQHPRPGQVLPLASVAQNISAWITVWDGYKGHELERHLARQRAVQEIDTPRAQIVVVAPTLRQHFESGGRPDLHALRQADKVIAYDTETARRLRKALSGTKVTVDCFQPPKLQEILHPLSATEARLQQGMTTVARMMFDLTPDEARQVALNTNSSLIPERSLEGVEQNPFGLRANGRATHADIDEAMQRPDLTHNTLRPHDDFDMDPGTLS